MGEALDELDGLLNLATQAGPQREWSTAAARAARGRRRATEGRSGAGREGAGDLAELARRQPFAELARRQRERSDEDCVHQNFAQSKMQRQPVEGSRRPASHLGGYLIREGLDAIQTPTVCT